MWVCTVLLVIFFIQVCPEKHLPNHCKKLAPSSTYVGCYKDNKEDKLLKEFKGIMNTTKECVEECRKDEYPFAGMEYMAECYCGGDKTVLGHAIDESSCNMPCLGDLSKKCGADGIISVYSLNVCPIPPRFERIFYLGCFSDSENTKILEFRSNDAQLTPARCIEECSSAENSFAGVEFGVECYCGTASSKLGRLIDEMHCQTPCAGDSKKTCGGQKALSVYSINVADPPPPISQCPLITPATHVTVQVTPSSSYIGCYNNTDPLLKGFTKTYPLLTTDSCIKECGKMDFPFAGMADGSRCYCGNLDDVYLLRKNEKFCGKPCAGNVSQVCGDEKMMSIYAINDTILFENIELSFNWWILDNLITTEVDNHFNSPFFYLDDNQFHIQVKIVTQDGVKRIRLFLHCGKGEDRHPCMVSVYWIVGFVQKNGKEFRKGLKFTIDQGLSSGYGWIPFTNIKNLVDGGYVQNGYALMKNSIRIRDYIKT